MKIGVRSWRGGVGLLVVGLSLRAGGQGSSAAPAGAAQAPSGAAQVPSGAAQVSAGAAQEAAAAQAKAAAEEMPGVVSGRVVFADTGGPGRFTKVLLTVARPVEEPRGDSAAARASEPGEGEDAPAAVIRERSAVSQQMAATARVLATLSDFLVSTTAAADGTFRFTNVTAGTYYVHAVARGYIDPVAQFSAEELTSGDLLVRQRVAAAVSTVKVSGGQEVRADLRLERGASISGRVFYDDGTPAVGWTVRTVHRAGASEAGASGQTLGATGVDLAELDLAHLAESSQTDDMGHYRIEGLATGEYVLQARFTSPALGYSALNPVVANEGSPFAGAAIAAMQGLKMTVYSGNVQRQGDAKALRVRAGFELPDYDLMVPLRSLHGIRGTVVAKNDGHPVNSGSVELTLQGVEGGVDTSLHLVALIQADGRFHFDYLPPGRYTLKAAHVGDAVTLSTRRLLGSSIEEQRTTHGYGTASGTVTIQDGDVNGVRIDVPDAAANQPGGPGI